MTQEEKARAYDEALKKMKELRDRMKWLSSTDAHNAMLAVEDAFPELAESEDERVRKNCIHFLGLQKKHHASTFEIDECIAYLEKQKDLFKSGRGLYYYDGENSYFIENPATIENPYDFAISQQEKQKEQKPDIELIQRSWYLEGYHDREFGMEPKWTVKAEKRGPRFYENPNYGKPLKQKEQKQDWSKEDEEALERAINCVRTWEIDYCDGNNETSERLKSFNGRFYLQPKSEWRHYIWAVNLRFDYDALIRYEDNGAYEIVTASNKPKRQVNGDYFLLKDTAYADWKPSEEQIYFLGTVVKGAGDNSVGSIAYNLKELYEQLKKLM